MTIDIVDKCDILSRGKRKYSDNELLEFLTTFEREKGRSPKEEDFINSSKYPCVKTYQSRFGKWNNALKLAGLQLRKGGSREYKDEELLEFLVTFEREEGR